MKIIFFGLGSIGQRHARLLLKNFKHTLFAYRTYKGNKTNEIGIRQLYSWEEIKRLSPDIAFITNPTFLHIKTAIECAKLGMNLFIEKPIDCNNKGLDELIGLVRKKRLITYVAYCMRFHPVIKQMRKYLINKNSLHCRIVTSSYLPSWRPGQDYRDVYSARRDKGGGVILDLSHELDYSSYLFGDILKMQGIYGRLSTLEIDSEDFADIIMRCKKGVISLHLDIFSKNVERKIRIDFKDSDYIEGDLLKNRLSVHKNGTLREYKYNLKRDDIYLEQLKYFFKNFRNPRMMNNLIDASKLFKKIIVFKDGNEA